jgi:glycolate oxidase
MDRVTIAAVDDWHNLGLDRSAAALLLVESDRPGDAADAELIAAEACCREAGAASIHRATDPMEADWLRQVRRLAFRAMERLGVSRMEDVGAPRSRLPELVRAIERIAAAHDVRCGTFGHAGDGNPTRRSSGIAAMPRPRRGRMPPARSSTARPSHSAGP